MIVHERATEKKGGITISEFRVYFPALAKTWHTINYIEPFHQIAFDINKDIEYYFPLGEKTEDPKRLKTLQEKGTQEKISYIPRM
ncbi:MAG: hypothetical protein ACWA6U_02035 [Breznakibacter sp.]